MKERFRNFMVTFIVLITGLFSLMVVGLRMLRLYRW
jgi:hypothetical protein